MSGSGYGKRTGKINLQGYMDVREVAAMVDFLMEKGVLHFPRYSDVLQSMFTIVLANLKLRGELRDFGVEEAAAFLKERGFSIAQLSGGGRGRNISRGIGKERIEEGGIDLNLDINSSEVGEMDLIRRTALEAMRRYSKGGNEDTPIQRPDDKQLEEMGVLPGTGDGCLFTVYRRWGGQLICAICVEECVGRLGYRREWTARRSWTVRTWTFRK